MRCWLRRESGAQHPGSSGRFECGANGALTADTSASGNNTKGPKPANTKPEKTEQPALDTLVVDVWGDPAMGSQLQILAPEDDV